MNWFLYIGGGIFIIIICTSVTDERWIRLWVKIALPISLLLIWIWACWKFIG